MWGVGQPPHVLPGGDPCKVEGCAQCCEVLQSLRKTRCEGPPKLISAEDLVKQLPDDMEKEAKEQWTALAVAGVGKGVLSLTFFGQLVTIAKKKEVPAEWVGQPTPLQIVLAHVASAAEQAPRALRLVLESWSVTNLATVTVLEVVGAATAMMQPLSVLPDIPAMMAVTAGVTAVGKAQLRVPTATAQTTGMLVCDNPLSYIPPPLPTESNPDMGDFNPLPYPSPQNFRGNGNGVSTQGQFEPGSYREGETDWDSQGTPNQDWNGDYSEDPENFSLDSEGYPIQRKTPPFQVEEPGLEWCDTQRTFVYRGEDAANNRLLTIPADGIIFRTEILNSKKDIKDPQVRERFSAYLDLFRMLLKGLPERGSFSYDDIYFASDESGLRTAVKIYLELTLMVAHNELSPEDTQGRRLVSEQLGLTSPPFSPDFWKCIGQAKAAWQKRSAALGVIPSRGLGGGGRQGKYPRQSGKGRGKGGSSKGNGATCFSCGKRGHNAANCRTKPTPKK